MLFDLTLIVSFWIVTRCVPSLLKLPGFDSDGHYYFYKQLKRTKQGPFDGLLTGIVHSEKAKLPLLWHWLITQLPFQFSYQHCKYINAVIELTFCFVIYTLVSYVFTSEVALFAVLLYLSTPLWFSTLAIGPRIVGFTPRLTCEILLSVFFLLVSVDHQIPNYVTFPVITLIAVLIILSFKFGIQAITFISLLYSLMSRDWSPIISIVVASILANWISGGYFEKAFREQINHLTWYFKMVKRGDGAITKRNAMRHFPAYTPGFFKAFIVSAFNSLLVSNSFTIILFKLPVLMILAGYYSTILLLDNVSFFAGTTQFVVTAAIIVFLMTSCRPFIFLGEAERYLNCIAIVLTIEVSRLCIQFEQYDVLYGLLAYGIVFFLVEYFLYPKMSGQSIMARENEDDLKVLNWLCRSSNQMTVLLYPYHAATGLWRIMGQTHHKLVFCFNLDKDFNERFERRYAATYPFTNLNNIDEMADDFGLNCVVIEKSKLPANVDFSPRWQPADVPSENYLILVEQGI